MSKLGGKVMSQDTDRDTAGGQVDTIVAGTNITVDATDPANPIVAATDTGEVNTGSNLGAGEGSVFKQKTGVDLEHRTLKQGANVTITEDANEITIAASAAAGDPLTTKGDIMAFDTDANRVPVGTNDQVLTADSAQSLGVKWATVPGGDPLTTKGDVFTFDTDAQRLAVGTNGQVLTADSAEATGIKWATPAGGGSKVISDTTSGSASNTVIISGLANLTEFDFEMRVPPTTATAGFATYFNTDTTAGNYRSQRTTASNATMTVSEFDDAFAGRIDDTDGTMVTGKVRVVDSHIMVQALTITQSGATVTVLEQNGVVKQTTDTDVTEIRFDTAAGAQFPTGTRVILLNPYV